MLKDSPWWFVLYFAALLSSSFIFWLRRPNPGPFRRSVQETFAALGEGISSGCGCLAGLFAGVLGCLLRLVLALVGLFFIIWLIKRMWEAA